jgi:hypothetical protein
MKWVDGELVENPDAQWAISDTTRDKLNNLVSGAFKKSTPLPDLVSDIQDADIFSASRAEMIARTEVSMAQNQGNLLGWKTSGLVKKIDWVLSSDHDDNSDCNCSDNAENGPYGLDDVPDFPDHPNCICNLQVHSMTEVE